MYFTEKGQPYLKRQTRNVVQNGSLESLRLLDSLDTVEKLHGPSTRLYFSFLLFLFCYNGFLALCSFVSWIIAIATISSSSTSSSSWSSLFVASYTTEDSLNWFWSNVILFCLVWLLSPCFYIWSNLKKEEVTQERVTSDEIVENVLTNRTTRYWLSTCCFLVALSISVAIMYGLIHAQVYVSQEHGDTTLLNVPLATLMSLPISVWFVFSNAVWDKVSFHLTQWEYNKRWLHFRISHATKLVTFKVTSATLLYLLIAVTLRDSGECSLLQGGINLFISICIDMFLVTVLVKTAIPKLYRWFRQKWHNVSPTSLTGPMFDLSEEYLTALYFQFLFLLTLPLMPLVGVLGTLSPLVQFTMARWKLMEKQHANMYIQGRPTAFLSLSLLFVSLATFLTFPNGLLWLLFLPHTLPIAMQNCSVILASPTF